MYQDKCIYKYHFKKGNRIIYTGITDDLERREEEHKRTYGKKGHIFQVGDRVTLSSAVKWEYEQALKGKAVRKG